MTIPNETDIATYTGSGTTGPFPFSFRILSTDQLRVFKTLVASPYTRTELTLTTDYTAEITGPNAGTVTTVDTVSSDYTITILRAADYLQESAFRTQGQQDAASWENAFDLACILARQLKRETDASIKIPVTEDGTDELPSRALRANGFLAFDAGGDPMISTGVDEVPAGTTISIVATIAALKAVAIPSSAVTYVVRGYSSIADGGGGMFVWDSASSASEDGGTIFAANAGGVGRWKRLYSGYINVKWFGATGDGTTNDTDAIDDALAYAVANTGVLFFPKGTYKRTTTLTGDVGVTLLGEGRVVSQILYTGTGRGIETVSPVNSSTRIDFKIKHLGITCNNASNADAGYADVGGSYIEIDDFYVSGFLYGIVLDQSEVVSIKHPEIIITQWSAAGPKPRGIWMVNGDDYTATATTGFTNRITIENGQFNSADTADNFCIVDDGGGAHTIANNNFNDSGCAVRACGVWTLSIVDNEIEGQEDGSIQLLANTLDGSDYRGPCQGVNIKKNIISPNAAAAAAIRFTEGLGGEITQNVFANTDGIYLIGNPHKGAGFRIAENQMLCFSSFGAFKTLVADSALTAFKQHFIEQPASSRVSSSLSAGARTVTPSNMVGISVGKTLLCMNSDGTNAERVAVTATGGTTFNATFASDKAANWVLCGTDPLREETGTWTPVLAGSGTAGSNTYTTQKGFYSRVGKVVHIMGNIVISAVDAAMAGDLRITGIPFTASALDGTAASFSIPYFAGFTLAGSRTHIAGIIAASGTYIELYKAGSAVTAIAVPHTDCGAAVSLYFDATYYASL